VENNQWQIQPILVRLTTTCSLVPLSSEYQNRTIILNIVLTPVKCKIFIYLKLHNKQINKCPHTGFRPNLSLNDPQNGELNIIPRKTI